MPTVQNNLEVSRYELYDDGQLAGTLAYRMENGQMWLMEARLLHLTEGNRFTLDEFLVRVFQDLMRRRIEVLPYCPEVRKSILRHPQYLKFIPQTLPGHFPLLSESAAAATVRARKTSKKRSSRVAKTERPITVSRAVSFVDGGSTVVRSVA